MVCFRAIERESLNSRLICNSAVGPSSVAQQATYNIPHIYGSPIRRLCLTPRPLASGMITAMDDPQPRIGRFRGPLHTPHCRILRFLQHIREPGNCSDISPAGRRSVLDDDIV